MGGRLDSFHIDFGQLAEMVENRGKITGEGFGFLVGQPQAREPGDVEYLVTLDHAVEFRDWPEPRNLWERPPAFEGVRGLLSIRAGRCASRRSRSQPVPRTQARVRLRNRSPGE